MAHLGPTRAHTRPSSTHETRLWTTACRSRTVGREKTCSAAATGRDYHNMKFNGRAALTAGLCWLCSVHAFNAGAHLGPTSRQANVQRSRWVSMSDKAAPAATTAASMKKRSITVQFVQETPAGYISVVDVKNFKATTNHRIVMSKDQLQHYSERAGKELEVGAFMTYIMKYMLDKGLKLQNTEGMIEASVFPVNYFTLKQLSYFYDDVEDKIVALCKEAPDLSEL